ncbi:probable glutathione peroxidase 8 [Phtheirospermum japonicum]|uniref:Glutathione peroxidase n=1 Tax=Phtheirospermum japonicum TaxID=374723 RepID=A0A830BZU5_9LAMI|nr:probable glutathione peroxidase 8 [Phtheirospermum japonicum]
MLNHLYEKYRDQGLEILAFPCNQFVEEEPGSNDQILDFVCTRLKSEFSIFGKIELNGDNAAPLYKFLKSGKWGIFGNDIKWNFANFLVDKNGQPVGRYYPTTSPLTIEVYNTSKNLCKFEENLKVHIIYPIVHIKIKLLSFAA